MALERYGLRKLELFFAFLIGVMVVTFGYIYVSSTSAGEQVHGESFAFHYFSSSRPCLFIIFLFLLFVWQSLRGL